MLSCTYGLGRFARQWRSTRQTGRLVPATPRLSFPRVSTSYMSRLALRQRIPMLHGSCWRLERLRYVRRDVLRASMAQFERSAKAKRACQYE